MSYLGVFHIDDYVGIPAATHRASSGAAYAPSALTYSIYEEATTTGLDEDVDMTPASPFDSVTGCYWVRRQLTAAAGFEAGKNYVVVVKATVDSVAAIQMHTFQVEDDLAARLGTPSNLGSGATVAANLSDIEGQTDDIGTAGAGLTALGDTRLANLDATVGSRSTYAGGAVASVTGDVAGKVLGGGASVITGVGVWSDLRNLLGTALSETTPGWLAAAFKKLFNIETPMLTVASAMRGTDGAYTGTPPTADAIGTDAAGKILATPANKLATDASGRVTPDTVTAAAPSAATVADAVLDEVVEGTLTLRQIMRLLTSFFGGKVTGGGTTTLTFRDVGDTKARITMTVAAATGDRSAVTLDGS